MYSYMQICTGIYECKFTYIDKDVYQICVYVFEYDCVCTFLLACVCTYIYVYMLCNSICTCLHAYMYACTYKTI